MKKLILILALNFITHAWAGGRDGGGGVVFDCPNHVYLADTYAALSSPEAKPLLALDADQIKSHIPQIIAKYFPEKKYTSGVDKVDLATALAGVQKELRYVPSGALALLGDDHIAASDIPKGCTKRQVAIQDIANRSVQIDEALRVRMSSLERGLLDLHEAMVGLRAQPGQNTTPIRSVIEDMIEIEMMLAIRSPKKSTCSLTRFEEKKKQGIYSFQYSMEKTAENEYRFQDKALNVNASVIVLGDQATFTLVGSNIQYSKTVEIQAESSTTVYGIDDLDSAKQGSTYSIACAFGSKKNLDSYDSYVKRYDAEIEKLGPAVQWPEPFAPSMASLPVGTQFILEQDIDVTTGNLALMEQAGLVERSTGFYGLLPDTDFTKTYKVDAQQFPRPERFARVHFKTYQKHFAKGMLFTVVSAPQKFLHRENLQPNLKGYVIKLVSSSGENYTIEAIGRMNGSSDLKIPQFAEMMNPYFKTILPAQAK